MKSPVLILGVPLLAAMLAGPMAFLAGQVSEPDPGDLYIVIGTRAGLRDLLEEPDVREAGPFRAPFGRIVNVPSQVHTMLVKDRYWILPATSVAWLCGTDQPE